MGSGTLFSEHATTSSTAVASDILCPTETYTGLGAPSDVRTACENYDLKISFTFQ